MFVENLKSLIRDKGTTQKELAAYVGVKQNTVSDWINKGNSPKIEHLYRICDFFDVDIGWLLNGKNGELSVQSTSAIEAGTTMLSKEERLLLENYRDLTEQEKDELVGKAARMAARSGDRKSSASKNSFDEEAATLENRVG